MRTKREKYPYIGKRMQEIREDLSWTQTDLAEKVQATQMAVSYMEAGTVGKVMLDSIILYATEHNISANWILAKNNSKINKYISTPGTKKDIKKLSDKVNSNLVMLKEFVEGSVADFQELSKMLQ